MRFPKVLSALVVGATLASASNAQDPGQARPSIKSSDAYPRVYAIFVDSWSARLDEGTDEWSYRRRAETASAAELYLDARDLMLAKLLNDPEQPSFGLRLDLTIGPDGRVAGCEPSDRFPERAQQAAAFCPMLRKQLVYLPALDRNWQPVTDRVNFLIQPSHEGLRSGQTLPAIANSRSLMAPRRIDIPDFRKASDWPPVNGLNYVAKTLRFARNPERGFGDTPLRPDEKAAGVVVFAASDGTTGCDVVIASGDQALDGAACPFVLATTKPSYARSTSYDAYPVLVTGSGKPERVIAPDDKLAKWISMPEEAADAFYNDFIPGLRKAGGDPARLQLNLRLDREGKVRDCRINESTGTTPSDIWACDYVTRELQYEPALDAFGRIRDDLDVWWRIPSNRL